MQGLKPLEGWRPIQPCCSCAGSKSRSGRPACGWRSQRDRQQVPHWWRKPEANTCLAPAALPTRVTSQKDADDLREEALRSIAAQRVDEQPGPPQALVALLPGMEPRLRRLDPRLLARLAEDIPSVAVRLIQLRTLFPGADVLSLVDHRPAVLLAEEFAAVPAAKEALARLFPDADIDAMVEEQPLLLVEDIELAVSELKRLMPNIDALKTLRYNPHMLVTVLGTRKLSLW